MVFQMIKKLKKSDWILIYEALDMLQMDYIEHGHPEDDRIAELLDYAKLRSERKGQNND